MRLQIDAKQVKDLQKIFASEEKKVRQQLYIAVNYTARRGKNLMAKEIAPHVGATQKAVKEAIVINKRASMDSMSAHIAIVHSKRLSLKEFRPRQTKAGVTYKQPGKGRKLRPGAFMGPRPGVTAVKLKGHVFQRAGSDRKPIKRLHGPSVWGVWLKHKLKGPSVEKVQEELFKQVADRIRTVILRIEGKIK